MIISYTDNNKSVTFRFVDYRWKHIFATEIRKFNYADFTEHLVVLRHAKLNLLILILLVNVSILQRAENINGRPCGTSGSSKLSMLFRILESRRNSRKYPNETDKRMGRRRVPKDSYITKGDTCCPQHYPTTITLHSFRTCHFVRGIKYRSS